MKKKFYKLFQDLYHHELIFIPNWTRFDIMEYFEIDIGDAAGASFVKNGVVVIWIKEFTFANLDYLVHESVHAANQIFVTRGQELSARNDEVQAYLVQWIFASCLKAGKKILKR